MAAFNSIMLTSQEKWDYYLGDMESAISSWSGVIDDPELKHFRERLKHSIYFYNAIAEVAEHYVGGLVGKAPRVSKNAKIEEWLIHQDRLSTQWNKPDPIITAVTQAIVTGESFIRIYKPKKYQDSPNPINQIAMHVCGLEDVDIDRDEDGFLQRIKYTYRTEANNQSYTEIYELLDNGLTSIWSGYAGDEPTVIDLGGRLPIFHLKLKSPITDSLLSAQRHLNKTLTMLSESISLGGFPDRTFLNVQPPGHYIEDPNSPTGYRFEQNLSYVKFGPGQTAFLQGYPIGNPPESYANPSVHFRDPVDTSSFDRSFKIGLETIYRTARLGHLLSEGDGSISGISRITMKSSYYIALKALAKPIEELLESIYESVLYLIGAYQPIEVKLQITSGETLPEERKQILEEFNAGLISRRTAMMQVGIEDPVAEEKQLQTERDIDFGGENIPAEEALY